MPFCLVAMGGTFDVMHAGHMALLKKAFSISDRVIIGLTSDELAKKRGKKILHTYQQRLDSLKQVIDGNFQKQYTISKLDNDFGPAVLEKDVQALVVSDETSYKGNELNNLRKKRNMEPVRIITVPMILAKDGKRISSTRIRNSEIDAQGNVL